MDKLKPCPFCGGEAEYFEECIFIMNNAFLMGVKCKKCGGAYMTADESKCPNDVFKAWNHRVGTVVNPISEFVQCVNCKHYLPYEVDGTDGKCKRYSRLVTYEDYCSGGERRSNNG